MKKIGVFTSGGDAPGMNACIRAVVKTGLSLDLDVYGIRHGYQGMMRGDIFLFEAHAVSNILQRGGTILKTTRSEAFKTKEGRKKAYEQLVMSGVEGLVAIGGDGTFTGASIFYEEHGFPVVGVPGTIDNDLYGTDYTVGFDTAVNTALDAIDKLRDTANSHDRIFLIEVMGHQSGHIAVHSGIGGGAEFVMVTETSTTIDELVQALKRGRDHQKTSFIVIIAEGGELGDAHDVARQVSPQLPGLEIRVSTLGHVQRGGSPSSHDRILSSRLGIAAVEALVCGEKDVMVGLVNDRITYTKFKDAVATSKMINPDLLKAVDILSK